jgi:hypothetical protein
MAAPRTNLVLKWGQHYIMWRTGRQRKWSGVAAHEAYILPTRVLAYERNRSSRHSRQ